MVHHRYICHKSQQSPVQDKARAVIRKYKHQMKQLEFKRLQKLVPSMDEMKDPTEVSTYIEYRLDFNWGYFCLQIDYISSALLLDLID